MPGRILPFAAAAAFLCLPLSGLGEVHAHNPGVQPVNLGAFPQFLHGDRRPSGKEKTSPWGRSLLLTFDDGPDLVGTPLILDELGRRGLKGVFFVNGHHIVRNRSEDLARRELLREAAIQGHLVANHTLNHKNLCRERGSIAAEIDGAAEIIAYATGVRPMLFRSPYGARCLELDRALAERGVIQVGWNMDPQEWKGEDEDKIVDYVTRILDRTQGPVILLLHDKNVAAARALTRILDHVERVNSNAQREHREPIRVVDYRVFLPARPLPETGLGPLLHSWQTSLGSLAILSQLF